MSTDCKCPDWVSELPKLNAPFVLQQIRQPGSSVNPVKQFKFCPWCGQELVKEEGKA